MSDNEECGSSVSMSLKEMDIAWGVGAFILTIIGNIIVHVASLRHKAIKLDRVSVVLIENLAVTDISFAFLRILPDVVCLWVIGGTFVMYYFSCKNIPWFLKVLRYLGELTYAMNVCLLPALTICKLLSLVFPLRARNMRSRDGYRLALAIWACMLLLFVVLYFYEGDVFKSSVSVAIQLSLFILLIFTTVGLLVTVHRARGLNRQGVFSISLVSGVYVLVKAPIIPIPILTILGITVPTTYSRIALMTSLVSSFSNPLIYYLTVRSFKEFVHRLRFECSGTRIMPETTNAVRNKPHIETSS